MSVFYTVAKNLCNWYCSVRFHVKVIGKDVIPKTDGFIIASNHQYYYDPVVIGMRLKRQLRFMAKEELFQNKFFGTLIHWLGAFEVKRNSADMTAINSAVQTVKDGGGLMLFPEGTRSKTGELQRFKSGAILVAAETGADIIPTAVYISKKKRRLRRTIAVRYGTPITNEELALDPENRKTFRPAVKLIQNQVEELLQLSREEFE